MDARNAGPRPPRRVRRLAAALVGVIALVVLGAGCGDSDDPPAAATDVQSTATAPPPPPETTATSPPPPETSPPPPTGACTTPPFQAQGGSACRLTLTVGGVTVVTDMEANVTSPTFPANVVRLTAPASPMATADLDGSLPPGWFVHVWASSFRGSGLQENVCQGPSGCEGTVIGPAAGADITTEVAAYICSSPVPTDQTCSPAAQANAAIDWGPPFS